MGSGVLAILALLLGCMAATVPVFMALFFAGLAGLIWGAGIDPQIVIEVLYRSMDKFALVVVLFFVLCGNIMTTGSIVQEADQHRQRAWSAFSPAGWPWPGYWPAASSARSPARPWPRWWRSAGS